MLRSPFTPHRTMCNRATMKNPTTVTVHGAGSSDGDFRPAIWASTASVT